MGCSNVCTTRVSFFSRSFAFKGFLKSVFCTVGQKRPMHMGPELVWDLPTTSRFSPVVSSRCHLFLFPSPALPVLKGHWVRPTYRSWTLLHALIASQDSVFTFKAHMFCSRGKSKLYPRGRVRKNSPTGHQIWISLHYFRYEYGPQKSNLTWSKRISYMFKNHPTQPNPTQLYHALPPSTDTPRVMLIVNLHD